MGSLSVVLFTLGIIVLILAWRLGNPPDTSPELLAALKGIAGVKREIGYIHSELEETGARLEKHEKQLQERKALGLKTEEPHIMNLHDQDRDQDRDQDQSQDQSQKPVMLPDQEQPLELLKILEQKAKQPMESSVKNDVYIRDSTPQVFSEKYRKVIGLYEQGWSTLEIAGHLAISQDAVNMVLRTYPRGGQL